ncbi:MAG: hypothetical protein ABI769_06295 [Pseudomonadota bacterium]
MRVSILAALAAVLMPAAAPHCFAQSPALPAAPQVTVGAPVLKVLQFNWLPVPGATQYELYFKPNASSPFALYGNPIQAPRTIASLTIPVHTLDWVNARYKVSACNAAGCTDSAEISVQDLMLTSIGYVKASNPDASDAFGYRLQLSQDGNTLVASAFEGSNATGVNGNQADNSSAASGAVYVFRRVGAGWRQEAYLKPDMNHSFQYFGLSFQAEQRSISVSANGALVAVGAPGEQFGTVPLAGAVYLFARAANGTWSQSYKIQLPTPQYYDYFGMAVDLNDAGTLLEVSSKAPYTSQMQSVGTTRVFKLVAGVWVLDASFIPERDQSCPSRMSGSGSVIVSICSGGDGRSSLRAYTQIGGNWTRMQDMQLYDQTRSFVPTVSGNGARVAVAIRNPYTGTDQVLVLLPYYKQWLPEAYIEPPPGAVDNSMRGWGESLAFNRNGTMLAIGNSKSSNGGAGVSDLPQPASSPPPSNQDGAVYVYQRGESGWTFLKMVKAPNPAHEDFFGRDIALSGNGLTLAVGALGEDSAARGIDGNQANNSKETAGAVYLY